MRLKRWGLGIILAINVILLATTGIFATAQGGTTQVGTLSVLHLDGQSGEYQIEYWLNAQNLHVRLDLTPTQVASLGGKIALQGTQVAVTLTGAQRNGASVVQDIIPLGTRTYNTLPVGDIHYYILPCRYGDSAVTPATVAHIEGLYTGAFPSIEDYFETTSHGAITNMSFTTRGWKTLPQPRSYYMNADLPYRELFDGCVALHDESITFTESDGVVLIINGEVHPTGIFALGGSSYSTLDGIEQSWRAVWMPPWTYDTSMGTLQVTAHEIGHSLGWPHSNLSDNDTNPYDNPWDIMSNSYNASAVANGVGVPKLSNLYHYHKSGWIPAENVFTPAPNTTTTLKLQAWRGVGSTTDAKYHLIDIPLYNGKRITVEASKSGSGYYSSGAANGVLIYNIDPSRQEDAWLLGAKDDAAAFSGGVWSAGETYNNKQFGISITVIGNMNDGYRVRVTRGAEINTITTLTPIEDDGIYYNLDFPFQWQAVAGAEKYIVQVKTLPYSTPAYSYKKIMPAASVCDELGVCTFVPNTDPNWLPVNSRYHTWTVTAKNAEKKLVGASEPVLFDFTAFSSYVSLYEPEDFATVGSIATFSWYSNDPWDNLVTGYRVQITRPDGKKAMNAWRPVTDYTCIEEFIGTKICHYTVDLSTLKDGIKPGMYKWKVFGRNAEVTGFSTSDVRYFTVDTSGRIATVDDIFRAP